MTILVRTIGLFLLFNTLAFASDEALQGAPIESLAKGIWQSRDSDSALLEELGVKNVNAYSYQNGLVVLQVIEEDDDINFYGFGEAPGYDIEYLTDTLDSDDIKVQSSTKTKTTLLIDDQPITLYKRSKNRFKLNNLVGTWQSNNGDDNIEISVVDDLSFHMKIDNDGFYHGRFGSDPAGLLAIGNWSEENQISPVLNANRKSFDLVNSPDGPPHHFQKLSNQPNPRLLLDGNGNPVSLDHLSIYTHISDIAAQTTLEFKFTNPNADSSEVVLELPLPSNATVISYSLDINGKMIDSTAVPKVLARQAFDEIEMRGVDPGLAEVTKNNQFRTEIYPVEQGQQRRVSVTYIELLNTHKGSTSNYELPLHKLGFIKDIDFDLRVNSASRPKISGLTKKTKFTKINNNRYQLSLNGNSFIATSALTIRSKPEQHKTGVGKLLTESENGDHHFTIWGNSNKSRRIPDVKKVVLAWDVSWSMSSYHQDYLLLMRHYLKKIKGVDLKVVLFSNESEELNFESGKPQTVLKSIDKINYDGASDLSSLSRIFSEPADYYLIFSDGLSTLGNAEELKTATPIYSVSPKQANVNRPFLNSLSRNGNNFSLDAKNAKKIAYKIGTQTTIPEIISQSDNINSIKVIRPYGFDSRFQINGKLTNRNRATLILNSNTNKPIQIELSPETADKGESGKYLWAQASLQPMLAFPNLYEKEITDLGLRLELATPYTSLIVLEEIDDYVNYGITPPETVLSNKEYEKLRNEFLEYEKEEVLSRKSRLLHHWQNRLDWWANPPKIIKKKERHRSDSNLEEVVVTGIRRNDGKQSISIEPWSPDTPYIKAINDVEKDKWYSVYLEQRQYFAQQPAFFMDIAKHFFQNGMPELGFKIVSNIIEVNPENVALQRMVAYVLFENKHFRSALRVLSEVDKAYPFQATSKRDLARTWQSIAEQEGQKKYFEFAIENYYLAAIESEDNPNGLPVVALTEMNRLIPLALAKGVDISKIDPNFIGTQYYDIRATVSWSNNMTDVDLHVVEPSGNIVYYGNRNSDIGGRLPYDNTSGFGPEVYLLKDAVNGTYTVEANYYSNDSVEALGPVTLILDLYINYGKKNEQHKTTSIRLDGEKENMKVGSFAF